MYAIIIDGARQLKVEEGQELVVDLVDAEPGKSVTFDKVLAVADDSGLKLGKAVAKATVTAEVLGDTQGPKLVVQKMRRRKNSRRKTGHRQQHTLVRISQISVG